MEASDRGQVSTSAAQVYEEFYLPALFQEWAPRLAKAAAIQPGHHVLDVACGTGVLARTAAGIVGPKGSVAGVDINAGMLALAAQLSPKINWHREPAENLPFPDNRFDAVVSQFGLMFFEDRRAAVREMVRVLKPGGRMAVVVWDSLENTPGYARMTMLLQELFGEKVAATLRAPFILGEIEILRSIFVEAGFPEIEITTITGTARFPSIQDWVFTDIKGWTLADMIDDQQYRLLLDRAKAVLKEFENEQGSVTFDSPAHIVSLTKA